MLKQPVGINIFSEISKKIAFFIKYDILKDAELLVDQEKTYQLQIAIVGGNLTRFLKEILKIQRNKFMKIQEYVISFYNKKLSIWHCFTFQYVLTTFLFITFKEKHNKPLSKM